MMRGKVTLVAECKWTTKPLGPDIITDLDTYKIPALRDAGFKIADDLSIVLFSKTGYHHSQTAWIPPSRPQVALPLGDFHDRES